MANNGLKKSLNEIWELSSNAYQNNVPKIDDNTSIDNFSAPLLKNTTFLNEFCEALIQRIVYTQFEIKSYNNPLKFLEGEEMPLGYLGQEIFNNPAHGRNYDITDFAGLLKHYESDTKVQYNKINFDKQYVVTVVREKIKQAMTSWNNLETYITSLTNSLYNGAYIDEYRHTKYLVSNAYRENAVQIEKITAPTTKETAEAFTEKAREIYLNFSAPTSNYNAWKKVGGYGREILTFTDPQDIVFIIKNSLRSKLDVSVLASAFNIDKADLLGRIINVEDFDIYDDNNNKIYDGSHIYGIMCDRRWFRIKTQDMYMEDFRNANNRSMNYYLNVIKMYQYSLFANAVVFADEEPQVPITSLSYNNTTEININVGDNEGLDIIVNPFNANTPTIQYTSSDEEIFIVEADTNNDRHCTLTAIGAGTATLTASAGNVEITLTVNVTAV